MLRTIRLFMIVLMLLLAASVTVILWARSTGVLSLPLADQAETNSQPITLGAPFTLTNHLNEPITEQALAGKPIAVVFGFTSCPEVCPTTLFDLDRWMTGADPGGQRLEAFFVTVDPERDKPENLNSYVTYFSDRITGITGPPEDVWALADAWAVAHEKRYFTDDPNDGYDVNHTASIFLMDAKGQFRGTISYGAPDRRAIEKLKNLL